ncbi:MAG: Rab family GTPase [Candidatus Odinarchaeota archaeon]
MDITVKIIIFGESDVGKTTLTKQYMTGQFETDMENTMGVNIGIKKIIIENLKVVVQIWDLAGDERFEFIFPTFIRGISGGILIYDITKTSNLNNLDKWINLYSSLLSKEVKKTPLLIVGNKLDLQDKRAIYIEEIIKSVGDYKILDIIECSAKTGQNVDLAFFRLISEILRRKGFI